MSNKEYSSFAETLRKFREEAGCTQRELARRIEKDPSNISRFESDQRDPPSRDVVIKIGESLHLGYEDRNKLLLSASYSPIQIGDVNPPHRAMQLLADIIKDNRVPDDEKDLIEQQLRLIKQRWQTRN